MSFFKYLVVFFYYNKLEFTNIDIDISQDNSIFYCYLDILVFPGIMSHIIYTGNDIPELK